jgi:hypothetical protein
MDETGARRHRFDRILLRGFVNRINELEHNGDVNSKEVNREIASLSRLIRRASPSSRRLVEMPQKSAAQKKLARTAYQNQEVLYSFLWVAAGLIGALLPVLT